MVVGGIVVVVVGGRVVVVGAGRASAAVSGSRVERTSRAGGGQSGDRSFSDLLKVISSARRFRSWIDSKEDNRDLLDAYYEEVTKSSWIDSLPTKAVQWALFGAAGLALTPLGVPVIAAGAGSMALSAFDGLLLERIGRGWRPNQFIDTKLTPFVEE